ncbi:hypothetical protein QJQ45_011801 [Haematococcus lacustris]|nr:hypothetical protein QJQ45_011801 [Haematococcus lacustris]
MAFANVQSSWIPPASLQQMKTWLVSTATAFCAEHIPNALADTAGAAAATTAVAVAAATAEQGKLPAKGKEYPGLGYKRLRDKPPKAQEQQQPAVAQ